MKHKEIMRAWLDGADVEFKMAYEDNWTKVSHVNVMTSAPGFSDQYEYRIKPKPAYTMPVWRYVWNSRFYGKHVVGQLLRREDAANMDHAVRNSPAKRAEGFVRWIDDPDGPGYSVEV